MCRSIDTSSKRRTFLAFCNDLAQINLKTDSARVATAGILISSLTRQKKITKADRSVLKQMLFTVRCKLHGGTENKQDSTITMADKHEYTKDLEEKLDHIKKELVQLESKIERTIDESEAELKQQLERSRSAIQEQIGNFEAGISDIKDASEDAWHDLCEDVEISWNLLADAMKKTRD